MNRFLTPLTNAIVSNGTIDKYIGDAVMAFWNAPLDDPAQEGDACHAALDMLDCVGALNQERKREASTSGIRFIPINIEIGINTGPCTVGNMGSDLRFQYTVMGDTVNLASRLENKQKLTACRSSSDQERQLPWRTNSLCLKWNQFGLKEKPKPKSSTRS